MTTLAWAPRGCHPGCRTLTVGQTEIKVWSPNGDNVRWGVDCSACGSVLALRTERGEALILALTHALNHLEPGTVPGSSSRKETPMYAAIINTPGYLPETEPIEFDTIEEAWDYLASCRREDEDNYEDVSEGYSATVNRLESASTRLLDAADLGLTPEYIGTIYGDTPGGAIYDLGLAYTVSEVER